jgi:SAM-dependent methyltransferase
VASAPKFLASRRRDVRDETWWSPFAYVGRRLRELVSGLLEEASPPARGLVVDHGCADRPYRRLLRPDLAYVGADLPGNPDADVVLDDEGRVPLADGSVDVVLSTQVLEHAAEPASYLAECHRLLRPGGALVLTTHGLMYFHRDPEDYWRWTCDGLSRQVAAAGFDVVTVRGVLGLAPAALQLLQDSVATWLPRPLRAVWCLLFQGLVALADRGYSDDGRRQNAMVLGVLAVKPEPTPSGGS